MPESKILRRIEYKTTDSPPVKYHNQAYEILWEDYYGEKIYTPLSLNLIRTYIPELAVVTNSPYQHPAETFLALNGFANTASGICRQLSQVLRATDGVIANQRIADLGCGSTGGTEDAAEFGYWFHPWLCRTLFELGAKPIGVDVGKLDGEKFEAMQTDLLQPGALDSIPDDSVDVVHTRALFSSPQLHEEEDGQLMRVLEPQIIRVLKPNGVFVYSRNF